MPHHTRAAAQTLNHIWVTDEILAEAFNRFTLVSHATRRYGSHVPGPLEARKRLARRQMGMSAVATAGGPPPGSDFAALFGFGAKKAPVELEKSWRWEAPKRVERPLKATPSQLQSISNGSHWSHPPAPPVAQDKNVILSGEVKLDTAVQVDATEASRESFQALLDSVEHKSGIDLSHMEAILKFLKGPNNKRGAMNFLRFIEWIDGREMDAATIVIFDNIVISKIERDGIHASEVAKIMGIWCRMQIPNLETRVTQMLNAYVRRYDGFPRSFLRSATKEMSVNESQNEIEQSTKGRAMETWLNILDEHPKMAKIPRDAKTWIEVYEQAFKTYIPTDLVNHLGQLSWQDLAIVLLRHRTPGLDRAAANVPTYSKNVRHLPILPQGRVKNGDVTIEMLVKEYRNILKAKERETLSSIVGTNLGPMVSVIELLKEKGLPHITMCEEMFEIVDRSKSAWVVDEFYKCMRRSEHLQMSDKVLDMVIRRFLHEGDAYQVHRAALIFMHYPHLPLSRFPELPLKLIDCKLGKPHLVYRMIHRLPVDDKVSVESPTGKPHQTIPEQHVKLVHLVAIKWAKCQRITDREAFRRVWECYRFLHDRHAPIDPLMSRALVRSGVTRYLQSKRRVPSTQMKYILDIVARVEGQDKADVLDRAVFSIWRAMRKNNPAGIRLARLQYQKSLESAGGNVKRGISRWSRIKARKPRSSTISRPVFQVAKPIPQRQTQKSIRKVKVGGRPELAAQSPKFVPINKAKPQKSADERKPAPQKKHVRFQHGETRQFKAQEDLLDLRAK